jgi:hypothetical protein
VTIVLHLSIVLIMRSRDDCADSTDCGKPRVVCRNTVDRGGSGHYRRIASIVLVILQSARSGAKSIVALHDDNMIVSEIVAESLLNEPAAVSIRAVAVEVDSLNRAAIVGVCGNRGNDSYRGERGDYGTIGYHFKVFHCLHSSSKIHGAYPHVFRIFGKD